MENKKENKTAKFIERAVKKIYEEAKYSNRMFTLYIYCNKYENSEFKYYFEVRKNNIPIYKRGLNTVDYETVHINLYKLLFNYLKKHSYFYSTLNNNHDIGNLRIYFKNNFHIEIYYNNDIDKLFFENLFMNYKNDIIEYKQIKRLRFNKI